MLLLKKLSIQWKLALLVATLLTAIAVVGAVGHRATTHAGEHVIDMASAHTVFLRDLRQQTNAMEPLNQQTQDSLNRLIESNRNLSDGVVADSEADIAKSHREVLAVVLAALALSGLFSVALILDIRSAIEKRDAREHQLHKLSQLVQQSPESIIITDLQGQIEFVNDSFVRISGYSAEELMGSNPKILQSGKTPPETYHAMWSALRHGMPWSGEFCNRRKDGSEYMEFAIISPIREPDGSISHYVAIKEDVTEKKRMGRELDQHRHHLEEMVASRTAELVVERDRTEAAARVKGDFLANMSHEIRTPINAVMGFANLCLQLDLPARGRDYVNKISISAESLLGIVNDVLDVSKMEAGKLEMEFIEFNFGEVLERVSNLFKLKAAEKGVELAIGSAPQVPERLMGDPFRLGQVLTNLMSNALKFTDTGSISLVAETLISDPDAVTLRFAVRDSGVGMTPQQLGNLFTAFTQADSSVTRKYGGTGLGLTISKQLVERMHGQIHVESDAGVGTCFSFTARFGVAKDSVAAQSSPQGLIGKRALVVEDNDAMRTLLTRNAADFGCVVEAVASGEAALARLQGGAQFDLMLLDWHLPGLDGLATARNLRAVGNPIPIILISGSEPDVARALTGKGDIQAFLPKPLTRSTLYDTMINVLLGHATRARIIAQPIVAPDLSGRRILLVDDNDFNREIGLAQLEITGAMVDTAENGALAVAAVSQQTYDLVLMDIQMPVMDGYSAARILRKSWPDLPILALTAHAMVEEKDRVQAAGMNDILTKPVLPKLLYAALGRWLANGPAVAPTPPVPAQHSPLVFDLATALTRVNGDRPTLDRFLRLFRDRNANTVAEMGAAVEAGNLELARRLAHSFKGGAGTVGLVQLQAAAAGREATLVDAVAGRAETLDQSHQMATLKAAWAHAQAALNTVLDGPSLNAPPPAELA
jgi:PAS domain S-box-containing protein